jgi:hypothetical protein
LNNAEVEVGWRLLQNASSRRRLQGKWKNMIMLILNTEQMLDLKELNETGKVDRRLEAVTLPDGRQALNADLLLDLDPGETWWHYRTLLLDLPAETVTQFAESAV